MKTKNRMRKAGFTLVELIVVIAVLGILGAGAAVGYSGYVKKAAKAADEQLVSQIKYALEVAYVADPSYSGAAAVVLSQDGAKVTPEASEGVTIDPAAQWVNNALTNAFGANWKNELKLEYGQWGNAAEKAKSSFALWQDYSDADGENYDAGIASIVTGAAKPSFANDVDKLFELVRDTAIKVNGNTKGSSGAALIKGAAELTADGECESADFADAWATSAWTNDILMDDDDGYNQTRIDAAQTDPNQADFLATAVANAGAIKARNTAVATYLRDVGYGEVYNVIANYTMSGSDNIPDDVIGILLSEHGDKLYSQRSKLSVKLEDALRESGMSDIQAIGKRMASITSEIRTYLGGGSEDSQAYKDGLAYYTMMRTVSQIEASDDDSVYWDEMAGAVSLYGSIARREASLDQLKDAFAEIGDNQVAITAAVGKTGLEVYANPKMILDAQ